MLRTMLNKTLTRLSLSIPALLAVSSASAHPGGHAEITMPQVINHMIASPFHVGIISAGVLAVAFALNKVAKRKVPKTDKPE